ncbi:MAG: EexN family lipoprotein [Pseudomonas sp.]|uniref:EexN family lipoprotein n=1 Tax=Pseudomonas sp. TaxID=306 RepID=UPI003D11390C
MSMNRLLPVRMIGLAMLLLAGCEDGPSPDVDWYVDNPKSLSKALYTCHHKPAHISKQACVNARAAQLKATTIRIEALKARDRAAAEQTPDAQRTVDWYKQHKYALRDKLERCRERDEGWGEENPHSCLMAIQAERRLFIEGGTIYYR